MNFCDFMFYETVSKEEFSHDILTGKQKFNFKRISGKIWRKNIIASDCFYIQFKKNKEKLET